MFSKIYPWKHSGGFLPVSLWLCVILNRLKKWVHGNLMRFRKPEGKVLHLGWGCEPPQLHTWGRLEDCNGLMKPRPVWSPCNHASSSCLKKGSMVEELFFSCTPLQPLGSAVPEETRLWESDTSHPRKVKFTEFPTSPAISILLISQPWYESTSYKLFGDPQFSFLLS